MDRPTKMFTMQMDATLHRNLKSRAADSGKTMGDLIIDGLAKLGIEAEDRQENEKDRNS